MAKAKARPASITVLQCQNPQNGGPSDTKTDRWVYIVKGAANTLEVALDQRLSKAEVQELINGGVAVTFKQAAP